MGETRTPEETGVSAVDPADHELQMLKRPKELISR
jgi:hypothetical protein